jgi:hypothetical protein
MICDRRSLLRAVPGLGLAGKLIARPQSPASASRQSGQTYSSLGYKICIIDFQNSDLDPSTLTNVDADKLGDALAEMGVDSALVYANNVFGLTFFKSKFAPKLKHAPDDFVGQWLAACRKRKIKTVLYHAVYWQEYVAQQHPEWTMHGPDGHPVRFTVGSSDYPEAVVTYLCLNSPFRGYYMKQVEELAGLYSFDSWFVDEYFWVRQLVCYNPHCVARWRERTGRDLPHPLPRELYPEYLDFTADTYRSFYRQIKDTVAASGRRNVLYTHNFGLDYELDDYLVMEANPQGADYYQTSIRAKLYRAYARGRELQMIPHRGNAYLDFTNAPLERLTWQSALITSHNSAVMWADLGHVDGTLDPIAVRSVKQAFQVVDRIVPAIRGTVPYAEVALLGSERSFLLTGDRDSMEFNGANKLLTDMHWPYDVVTEGHLNDQDLGPYQLLIVPATQYVSADGVKAVLRYVERGGNLLFTDRSAMYRHDGKAHAAPRFGLVRVREGKAPRAYIKPVFPISDERLKSSDIGTVEPGSYNVLGTLIEPTVYQSPESRFVDSPYPGEKTTLPVIVAGARGKGNFVYLAYRFFEEYLKQDLPVFAESMSYLTGGFYRPRLWVDAPRAVEAVYNRKGNSIAVALVNSITGRPTAAPGRPAFNNIVEVIPVHDIKIVVRDVAVRQATDLDGRPVPVQKDGARTVITLSRLDQYDVITLGVGR